MEFKNVPNVIGIYISKFDVFKGKKTVYHIDRVIRETGQVVDNGLKEIYVNTKIDDGTDISELMRIFQEDNVYDFEKFPKVSARKKQFKQSEGGHGEVCDLVENYAQECAEKAARKAAKKAAKNATKKATQKTAMENAMNFFENGASYELVRASISLLSDKELQEIFKTVHERKNAKIAV